MSFDNANNYKAAVALAPSQRTASVNGTAVDSTGYESLSFSIATGVGAALSGVNKFTFTVESSADGSTGWTAIAADDYVVSKRSDGSSWDKLLDAAGDASTTFVIGVRILTLGFFRVVATAAAAPDVFVSAVAVLGNSRHKPN